MMKKMMIVFMSLMMVASMAAAKEIGGKNLPDSITAGKETLALNGGGLRVKWMMDIYAGGLYTKTKTQDAAKLIEADEAMAIKVHIISGLMNDTKMADALKEGFEKSTKGNLAPIQSRIDKLIAVMKGEYKPDDVFDFIYVPEEGVNVYKNGRLLSTIKGLDFKKPLFGIWLCDEPAQEDLKQAMLGKK